MQQNVAVGSLAAGYESNCYFKAHDEKVVNIKVKVKVYMYLLGCWQHRQAVN